MDETTDYKDLKRPPRLSADLRYFRCQKILEGGIFRGCDWSQILLSDLDLGRPYGVRTNLRGRPRPETEKLCFYTEVTEAEVLLKV